MNNTCPTCGALYAVTSKDVGRKLKCKKCNTALMVTDAGLVVDGGAPAPPPPVVEDYDDEPAPKKRPKYSGPGTNPLEAIGGIPTLLFGLGVFFVILFTALPIIGVAGVEREKAYIDGLDIERRAKIKEKEPKKKRDDWSSDEKETLTKETKKINEEYSKLMEEAKMDAEKTEVRNVRTRWFEQYGLMFGFLFLSFGCIGYLRTEQHLIMKIVAAAVLTFMLWIMFMKFGGCQTPRGLRGD